MATTRRDEDLDLELAALGITEADYEDDGSVEVTMLVTPDDHEEDDDGRRDLHRGSFPSSLTIRA
jgi:hypothetical protein